MNLTEEDKRIQIKLEQDFPVDIKVKPVENSTNRKIFIEGMDTGLSYSTDTDTANLPHSTKYVELLFYEQLRNIIYQYFGADSY
jgi:hypothetical protein